MAEKAQTGRSAWGRLFAELMAQVEVEGEPLEVALSRLMHPDRETRRTTAEAITAALEPGLRTRAYIFNTLALDKSVDDRLRNYTSWVQSRNLSNEASDESVQALVDAVQGRYEIARRWYRLKAKLLGVDRLADYDRMAPVITDEEQPIAWSDAKTMVLDSYRSFSRRARRPRRRSSTTTAGSTRPCARTSAAARSARTPSPPSTRTCCSTTPRAAATS